MSGMNFNAFKQLLPNPNELEDFYGRFPYRPDPTKRGWIIPDHDWERLNIVSVPTSLLPGWPRFMGQLVSGVRVHRFLRDFLIASWDEVVRRGLHTTLRSYDGAYAPRHINHNPANGLSTHAFGAALDFDAPWNGVGVPLSRAPINRDFVRCMEECGWVWGGRFPGSSVDAMHFQATQAYMGTSWAANPKHSTTPPRFPVVEDGWKIIIYNANNEVLKVVDIPDFKGGSFVQRIDMENRRYHIRAEL